MLSAYSLFFSLWVITSLTGQPSTHGAWEACRADQLGAEKYHLPLVGTITPGQINTLASRSARAQAELLLSAVTAIVESADQSDWSFLLYLELIAFVCQDVYTCV